MKTLCFAMIASLLVSACGNNSSSNGTQPGNPQPPQSQKKVQPGTSLTFTCPDSFNKTMMTMISAWDEASSLWIVSIEEHDAAGNQILVLKDLVGLPSKIESLHMEISKDFARYARVVQTGENQVQYNDGKRILNCTFE